MDAFQAIVLGIVQGLTEFFPISSMAHLQIVPAFAGGARCPHRVVHPELFRQSDDLTAMTTTHFNANANRLNALATRLTVLATFFLIWTLVTSFFGQNFRWLTDQVESRSAFLVFGVGGLLVPTLFAAVYFWRRRREWL